MDGKKIDKDQLMSDLAAYLSEEYMDCVAEKEKLIEEKYKLEEEKERMVRCVMLEKEKRQIRSVFSPLALDENRMEEVKEPDTREVEHALDIVSRNIRKIQKKCDRLKAYLKGLEENYFVVSGLDELEKNQEQVMFLPAFYDLTDHLKKIHPEISINCERIEKDSPVTLTFSFLTGFYQIIKFAVQKVGICSISIDTFIENDRVMLQFVMKPKKQASIQKFKKDRNILEDMLTREFAITRWQENSLVLQAIIEA